jgi:hypothetical protein
MYQGSLEFVVACNVISLRLSVALYYALYLCNRQEDVICGVWSGQLLCGVGRKGVAHGIMG